MPASMRAVADRVWGAAAVDLARIRAAAAGAVAAAAADAGAKVMPTNDRILNVSSIKAIVSLRRP